MNEPDSSLPYYIQHAKRDAPFVEHQGQRLIFVSEFESFSGPFDELQKLRDGSPHSTLFKEPDDKTPGISDPEKIRQSLAFYGLTLADIGSSEEELSSLVEQNARLQAAGHLLRARSGFAWSLYDLQRFEKIRAFLQADYESFGITEEEVKICFRQLHMAAAKLLLNEIRLPHRGDSFASSNPNPDNLARLEEHLAQAKANPADLGFSAEEWEALKKQRLLYHAIWFLKKLNEGLVYYEDPFREFDMDDHDRPFRGPDEYVKLVQGLLTQVGETPAALGLSEEEFQSLARKAAFIRLVQNVSFLMEKGKSQFRQQEHVQATVDVIRQDMATYTFTWDDLGINRRQFRYHLNKWGVK
jgi:hypothetical protein